MGRNVQYVKNKKKYAMVKIYQFIFNFKYRIDILRVAYTCIINFIAIYTYLKSEHLDLQYFLTQIYIVSSVFFKISHQCIQFDKYWILNLLLFLFTVATRGDVRVATIK